MTDQQKCSWLDFYIFCAKIIVCIDQDACQSNYIYYKLQCKNPCSYTPWNTYFLTIYHSKEWLKCSIPNLLSC